MTCKEETLKKQLSTCSCPILQKTEKLKNWIHMENLCLNETEKLKNWKTEKLNPYGESLPGSLWKKQFFSFSVFQFFSFRNYFGIFPEKLKNWKTEFSRDIQAEILHMDSVFQFFSFSGNIPQ